MRVALSFTAFLLVVAASSTSACKYTSYCYLWQKEAVLFSWKKHEVQLYYFSSIINAIHFYFYKQTHTCRSRPWIWDELSLQICDWNDKTWASHIITVVRVEMLWLVHKECPDFYNGWHYSVGTMAITGCRIYAV